MSTHRILAAAAAQPWAMHRASLERMLAVAAEVETSFPRMDLFAESDKVTGLLDARAPAVTVWDADAGPIPYAVARPGPKTGLVARVPVMGLITQRDLFWSLFFGGMSTTRLGDTIRQLAGDETVGTILLDIDSPGGTAGGLSELAATIRTARQSKSVVAVSNSMAASAAYWIASQADEIIATPESLTGSVGVYTLHQDWSGFWEQMGVTNTYIAAGKYKVEGNAEEPLGDEAQAYYQAMVDEIYGLFVNDVATGRGITAAKVRSDYGEGRVLTAKDAKAAGLIDRIATFSDTVARLSGAKRVGGAQAALPDAADVDMSTLPATYSSSSGDVFGITVHYNASGVITKVVDPLLEADLDAWAFGH